MNAEQIKEFLDCIDAQKVKLRANWIICSCPVSPWTHMKGSDKNPSFGIEINVNGPSRVNCYSCGMQGDMLDLILEFIMWQRKTPMYQDQFLKLQRAVELATNDEATEVEDMTVPDYDNMPKKKKSKFVEFPEYWLASFAKITEHPYLKSRGVSPEIAEYLDARFDMSEKRVAFPIRTKNGKLAGMHGRYATDPVPEWALKHKMYDFNKVFNQMVWFNEDRIDLDIPLVLTEGTFDVASIMRVYTNVAGSLTSQITYDKAKRLRDASRLITFYDYGTGGNLARKLVDKYWPNAVVTHIIPDQEEDDAGSMTQAQIEDVLLPLLEE